MRRQHIGHTNLEIGTERVVVPDPEQAPIVRRMFEWYATGMCSLGGVRERAIEAGLRGRRGTIPSKSTVAHTLRNIFYTGMFLWKGQIYQGDHEPLISMDLFERTQAAFKKDGKPAAEARAAIRLHRPPEVLPLRLCHHRRAEEGQVRVLSLHRIPRRLRQASDSRGET